jgi:hypothetical protein
MKIDIEKAAAFVYQNGDEIQKARLDAILKKRKPSDDIVKSIEELQNPDGGFPYKQVRGELSTLNNTEGMLVWLDDLGCLRSDIGKRAFHFLLTMQKEDGSWDENPEISKYNPPPWMVHGDRRSIIYHTAYCSFWLGVGGWKESVQFNKGYRFLKDCQNEVGKIEGFLHNSWIGISVFAMESGWESVKVRKGITYLESVKGWEPSQISWMLWCFVIAHIPKENPFAARMLHELPLRQRLDGSFASEDGDEFAVNATIEALKVISLFKEDDSRV